MYRNFRPEPLSPSRPKVNRDLIIPEQMRLMSLSPNLYDRNQLRSPKLIDSISNMKIFNEENDKGGPDKLWNDNINRVHHPKPINYDVIHSVTFKPDQLNPSSMNSIFFNRRKSRKSPSANHKNSQNSQNDEDKRNIVCKFENFGMFLHLFMRYFKNMIASLKSNSDKLIYLKIPILCINNKIIIQLKIFGYILF